MNDRFDTKFCPIFRIFDDRNIFFFYFFLSELNRLDDFCVTGDRVRKHMRDNRDLFERSNVWSDFFILIFSIIFSLKKKKNHEDVRIFFERTIIRRAYSRLSVIGAESREDSTRPAVNTCAFRMVVLISWFFFLFFFFNS